VSTRRTDVEIVSPTSAPWAPSWTTFRSQTISPCGCPPSAAIIASVRGETVRSIGASYHFSPKTPRDERNPKEILPPWPSRAVQFLFLPVLFPLSSLRVLRLPPRFEFVWPAGRTSAYDPLTLNIEIPAPLIFIRPSTCISRVESCRQPKLRRQQPEIPAQT
jgi:hypothetical protein